MMARTLHEMYRLLMDHPSNKQAARLVDWVVVSGVWVVQRAED